MKLASSLYLNAFFHGDQVAALLVVLVAHLAFLFMKSIYIICAKLVFDVETFNYLVNRLLIISGSNEFEETFGESSSPVFSVPLSFPSKIRGTTAVRGHNNSATILLAAKGSIKLAKNHETLFLRFRGTGSKLALRQSVNLHLPLKFNK